MSIPYIDNNGNLISNNSIISPTNQSFAINNWGNYVHDGNQWNMVLNNNWNNSLNQNDVFKGMNLGQQQGFGSFLAKQNIDPLKVNNAQLSDLGRQYLAGEGKGLGQTGASSLFGFGKDANGNTTFAGGTGLQWLGGAAQLGMGLWGAYQQNKQLKLAQQAFEEQRALQRANFKMQAKSYNNSLRNQQSGRGYVGMSGSAARTLGRDYDSRKADETY